MDLSCGDDAALANSSEGNGEGNGGGKVAVVYGPNGVVVSGAVLPGSNDVVASEPDAVIDPGGKGKYRVRCAI